MTIPDCLKTRFSNDKATTVEALEYFDELAPVTLEFMYGRWRGSELHTNNPLDGLLETYGWYGKEFIDAEQVHPLLFLDARDRIIKVDPNPLITEWGLRFPPPQNKAWKPVFNLATSILQTNTSKARIKMVEYRDKVSATMIYDYLPINDIFRQIDDNNVLGLMDHKGIEQPFFFVLTRE